MSSAPLPIHVDLTVQSSGVLAASTLQAFNADHTTAVPSYASVSGTWTWKFRRAAASTVVLLDADARVSVVDASTGVVQVGPLTTTDTEALTGSGVYDLAHDGLVVQTGRWTATARVSR